MRRFLCAASAAAIVTLTGCGSDEPELECVDVQAAVADTITEGANEYAIEPTGRLGAVKSPQMEDAYIVAMEFHVEGVEDADVGVWALPNLDGSGPVMSVDALADGFTDWPNEINGHAFDVTEPGVEDAKLCLEQ